MSTMQVVFLLDLNAFNDAFKRSEAEFHQKLVQLRLTCLRILTHFSSKIANFKWGFKFFDSKGSLTQTMSNFSFASLSLENFETLENEMGLKFQRHVSYLVALEAASHRRLSEDNMESEKIDDHQSFASIQLLQLALTQILCEYQWNDNIEMFSPSTRKTSKKRDKRNMLFFLTKCFETKEEFKSYFGADFSCMKPQKLSKLLLSQSLNEQLLVKSSVVWVWMNTSEKEIRDNAEPEVVKVLSTTLNSLHCAIIPLTMLSQTTNILRLEDNIPQPEKVQNGQIQAQFNLMFPFSSIVSHLLQPLYCDNYEKVKKDIEKTQEDIKLCFYQSSVEMLVNLTKFQNQKILQKEESNCKRKVESTKHKRIFQNIWNKCIAYFAIKKNSLCLNAINTTEMFLCLPSSDEKQLSCNNFLLLVKSLLLKNICLFLLCEYSCGKLVPGILTPVSDTVAVIIILESHEEVENLFHSDLKEISNSMNCFQLNDLKPFQIECLETWYKSSSTACSSFLETLKLENCNPEVQNFHAQLKSTASNSKEIKTGKVEIKSPEHNELLETEICVQPSSPNEDYSDICKDLNYDQLATMTVDIYKDCIASNSSPVFTIKRIVKLASMFFLQRSIISFEENMKSMVTEFFSTTSRKLVVEHMADPNGENTYKRIKECKLQVILALEMEILFPSADTSCVDTVVPFLGALTFFTNATELGKFMKEVLLESYGASLHDTLLEIGEDMGYSLNPEDEPPDESTSMPSSLEQLTDSMSSTASSVRGPSSVSSLGDSRKLVRRRSDISDSKKSRQILLPAKLPDKGKKKRQSSAAAFEKNAVRYSPRLASRKRRERNKCAESVRRNLFSREKKVQTPRISQVYLDSPRKKALTPGGHHVLKTNFVPNTPSHKRNKSALQRRKSQMDSAEKSMEIVESPTVLKNAKDTTNLRLLQNLKESASTANSSIPQDSDALPSCSTQVQYTPESKRRLSLKLFFSKLLTSPTARVGLKKCSKRLFDQVTHGEPKKSNKRMKFEEPNDGS